jgi:hypothetical protein
VNRTLLSWEPRYSKKLQRGRGNPYRLRHLKVYLEHAMKKLLLLLLAIALPQLSWAQLVLFETHLSGSQENPPNASPATGFGTASLDLSTNFFVFNDTWSGLSAPATASHIHAPAPLGTNAPVIIPFTSAYGFVVGSTSGSVNYSGTLTSLQASELLGGLFYVNVHSTQFPGGEIRGQILATPVPESSTYALGGGVLLLLLVCRRFFSW